MREKKNAFNLPTREQFVVHCDYPFGVIACDLRSIGALRSVSLSLSRSGRYQQPHT